MAHHIVQTFIGFMIVDNLVVVFRDQGDIVGNGMTIGWEWK